MFKKKGSAAYNPMFDAGSGKGNYGVCCRYAEAGGSGSYQLLIIPLLFIVLFFGKSSTAFAQTSALSDTLFPRLYVENAILRQINIAYDPTREAFYTYLLPESMLIRINKYSEPDTLIDQMPADFLLLNMEVKLDGSALYLWDNSGGRVFNYDIEKDSLYRIDRSFKHRAFYYHAPALTADDRIWFMGGYGFFTKKNLLVYYDDDMMEWIENEVRGFKPPVDEKGYLISVPEEDAFYYFDWHEQYESDEGPRICVYRFDLIKKEWKFISTFNVPEEFREPLEGNRITYRSTGTYKYDPVNKLIMIENILSYDIRNDQMIFFDRTKYNDSVFGGINFYDRKNKQFYFLSLHPTTPQYLDVYAFTYDELPEAAMIRVDPNTWYKSEWFMYLSGLLTAFIFGFTFYRLLAYKEDNEALNRDGAKIKLSVSGDKIELNINGNRIPVTDPSEAEMWKLVNEMLDNDQLAISMSDADDRLFGSHVPISQRSRNRKKLIDTIHTKTDCSFLTIKRDDVDKRFKVLTIDPGCFETDPDT